MAAQKAKMGHRKGGPARQQARVDRASVKPSYGQMTGMLRGYSLIVDGEEVEVGLGLHEALGKARDINGPIGGR